MPSPCPSLQSTVFWFILPHSPLGVSTILLSLRRRILTCSADGSIAIHLSAGETLPTIYFHDDESRSFTSASTGSPRQQHSAWGGEELLQRLRVYANILRSSLQSTLFLVNPSRADIEMHTTILYADDAVDEILNPSTSLPRNRRSAEANGHSRRTSVLHQTLAPPSPGSQARLTLLQGFSQITKGARSTAQRILSHPLAKPIVPHLPDPVKSLVNVNGEWASWVEKGGVGEFESARVYLARWARIVAEEGERARQREVRTMGGMPGEEEEDGGLGVFEVLKQTANLPTPKSTRDPKHPIDKETWSNWFAGDGRPLVSKEYMRQEVFRRVGPPSFT
jgi:TBC1 domain family member 15